MFTAPVGMLRRKGVGPQFVHASPVVALGSGNNQITVPNPGTQFGDLMLFVYWGENNSSQITSGPVGWTQQVNNNPIFNGSNYFFDAWDHGALGSDPGPYTWNLQGGSGNKGAVILVYRPANLIQPDVVLGTPNLGNNTNTFTQPSVTTNNPNTKVVYAWGLVRQGNSPLSGISSMFPLTQRIYSDFSAGASSPWLGLAIGDQAWPFAGPTGTRTLTTVDVDVSASGIIYGVRA